MKLGLAQEALVDPHPRLLSESCFGLLGDHGVLAANPVESACSEGAEDVFTLTSALLDHFVSLSVVDQTQEQSGAEAPDVLVGLGVCFAKVDRINSTPALN